MKRKIPHSILFILVSIAQVALAYEGPSPLTNVGFSASILLNKSSGIYTYAYVVQNPKQNDDQIQSVSIFIGRNPSTDSNLPSQNLTNCPHYAKHSSQDIFSKTPLVPVGSGAPDNWSCGYGLPGQYATGFFGWDARVDSALIKPGSALSGFALTSYGLPAIQNVLVEPYIDLEVLPDDYEENLDKTIALENSVKWMGKTVGPKAPPKVFDAGGFVTYLISLKEQSRAQGWIDNQGVATSLDEKLNAAKAKIVAGDNKTAKNIVNAFLNDVQAQNGKHLRSEAYALLYYNGQYLVNHL